MRAAPHEDTTADALPAADGPGLEPQLQAGVGVGAYSRTSDVIIGDMLQEATGGYLLSTTHRVAPEHGEAFSRMSLPLFLHPRPEVALLPHSAGQYDEAPQ